jgi:hypothetical protein
MLVYKQKINRECKKQLILGSLVTLISIYLFFLLNKELMLVSLCHLRKKFIYQ